MQSLKLLSQIETDGFKKSALPPLQLFLWDNFTPVLLRLRAGIVYGEKSVLTLSRFSQLSQVSIYYF